MQNDFATTGDRARLSTIAESENIVLRYKENLTEKLNLPCRVYQVKFKQEVDKKITDNIIPMMNNKIRESDTLRIKKHGDIVKGEDNENCVYVRIGEQGADF